MNQNHTDRRSRNQRKLQPDPMKKNPVDSQSQTSPPYSPHLKQHQTHRSIPKFSLTFHHHHHPIPRYSRDRNGKRKTRDQIQQNCRRKIYQIWEGKRNFCFDPVGKTVRNFEILSFSWDTHNFNEVHKWNKRRRRREGHFYRRRKRDFSIQMERVNAVAERAWNQIQSASSVLFVDLDRSSPEGNGNMPRLKLVW